MNISTFKKHFYKSLEGHNSPTETQSIFNLLTQNYLGMNRLQIAMKPEKELTEAEQTRLGEALERLKKHEPIQYILGETEFFGMPFKINSNVLVPRPETETLVEWVLESSEFRVQSSGLRVLDIGTGSGILAVSLAKNLPRAKVFALDISEKALKIAEENAVQNKVEIGFIHENVLEMETLPQEFDILVSNPPYIREVEKKDIQRNILDHEPPIALFVTDKNPMVFNLKIAELASKSLSENGAVYVEINQYLGKETENVFREKGFSTELRKDIFGNQRVLKAWKP